MLVHLFVPFDKKVLNDSRQPATLSHFSFVCWIMKDHNWTINTDNLFLEHPEGLTNKCCGLLEDS